MVTVLQQEAEFAWILTAGGVEGFLKLKYLPQFEAQYTAKVQRHGNGGSTRLRKVATHSRDGDVWVAGGTCVLNDEVVTVLRREAEFAWIRTAGGVEGYLKLSYLQGVGGARDTRRKKARDAGPRKKCGCSTARTVQTLRASSSTVCGHQQVGVWDRVCISRQIRLWQTLLRGTEGCNLWSSAR